MNYPLPLPTLCMLIPFKNSMSICFVQLQHARLEAGLPSIFISVPYFCTCTYLYLLVQVAPAHIGTYVCIYLLRVMFIAGDLGK